MKEKGKEKEKERKEKEGKGKNEKRKSKIAFFLRLHSFCARTIQITHPPLEKINSYEVTQQRRNTGAFDISRYLI